MTAPRLRRCMFRNPVGFRSSISLLTCSKVGEVNVIVRDRFRRPTGGWWYCQ